MIDRSLNPATPDAAAPAAAAPVLPVATRIAQELQVRPAQVAAAVALLDEGATVPFIARYRKEVTGSLDDTQLRTLQERLGYLRELDDRRTVIAESIASQGKLTGEIAAALATADTKARLEDIYLPYKPKRRTKAQIAREAGLEPLADLLLTDPSRHPERAAADYLAPDQGFADTAAVLGGVRSILVERFGEHADLVGELRELMWRRGRLVSQVRKGRAADGAKFADYFDFSEALTRMPSHRVLAVFRGEKEQVLQVHLSPESDASGHPGTSGPEPGTGRGPGTAQPPLDPYEQRIARAFRIADRGRPADRWLLDTVRRGWRTRLQVGLEVDLRMRLRQRAEEAAARVFAANLRDLLLAAPAGSRPTLGLDPGYRTGVKVAVVDGTGKVVATDTVYPHQPQNRWDQAGEVLDRLITAHGVELIAIGNGTASRETDRLAAELVKRHRSVTKVLVSEAGASVYSASAYAAAELPELDVSLRGAVSIARRLQDPLAELVKIEPKSIGVGQYQHDLAESLLAGALDNVVEDCVNAVGVDVNTASAPLLRRVSGMTGGLAENLVRHRDAHGAFRSRTDLRDVPRLGPRAFEQCAGFLRIPDGDDPLDRSGVHPESYPVVRRIVAGTGVGIRELVGNTAVLRSQRPESYVDDSFGVPTVTDILRELEKPGRDPRPSFRTATFADGIEKIGDLRPGMVLEGVVTNVAAFGAFVDIGVHQDGLVHISAMSDRRISDPREVVNSGQVVRVRVLGVDPDRKRISLSLRLQDEPSTSPTPSTSQTPSTQRPAGHPDSADRRSTTTGKPRTARSRQPDAKPAATGSMADALRRAGFGG